MTDQDTIQFGKHKGKKLCDVPAAYLLYVYEDSGFEGNRIPSYRELCKWIIDNLTSLRESAKTETNG